MTWDDFKGITDSKMFPEALAVTNSGLGYDFNSLNLFKEGKVFVRTVFYNYGSWVLPEDMTDYVLRHEQIHFDITEIYSRMLRKGLIDAKISRNSSLKAKAIYEEISRKWRERQEYYDYQTKHGKKKEVQENWEASVKIELAKYDLYKNNK